MTTCTHLEDEVKIVEWVMKKHLDRYKWFRGIANKTEAEIKFVQEYAFLIRDIYCEFCCSKDCIKKDYPRHNDEQYLFPDFKEGGMGK